MRPWGKRDFEISFWVRKGRIEKRWGELENTFVKYRHLSFLIKTEVVFPAYVLSYMHVCGCSLYVVFVCCYHAIAGSLFDFRGRSLRFHARRAWQSVADSEYWCMSELLNSEESDKDVLCHRNWESTTQEEKDLKVVEYLGGKAV